MKSFKCLAFILLPCCLWASCATKSEKPPKRSNSSHSVRTDAELPSRLKLSLKDTTLGLAVRQAGLETGGRFAVMNGLENLPIDRIAFNNADFDAVAKKLSEKTGCAVQQCPSYYFLFWPGYESLTEVSFADVAAQRFIQPVDRVAFGSGIPLYAVFAWLSQALHTTIIADNAVAEAQCGEIALRDVPLAQGVEAIVKTARLVDTRVECTEHYMFIRAKDNRNPQSCLLSPETLNERQRAHLEARTTVILPRPPDTPRRIEIEPGAAKLAESLPTLSQQLGVPVVAEDDLSDFPVNPAAFMDVPVRVVMDLLIRQWLAPEFGYQFTSDRIVIRRRTPTELKRIEEAP